MNKDNDPAGKRVDAIDDRGHWPRWRMVTLYALSSALWIVGSDSLLNMLVQDRSALIQLETYKGWLFVAVTSVVLFRCGVALQRQFEGRNRAQQALQDTIADLEAFSYTVSHDLRSPLAAIDAFAVALLESEAPVLSTQGRHRLTRIVAGSRRMNRMIDHILACSRAERTGMTWQTVDLGPLVADVVAETRHRWPATQVAIGPLPAVRADPTMLRQVLANLIGNALKFSGGRADARVEVDARMVNGATEISVRDNGVGFDMAYADKLFGLFQRLHSEAEFPGTGAGLAIAKRLVLRHGGSIRAESVPGGWTTFCFILPGLSGAPVQAHVQSRAAHRLSVQRH